MDGLAVTRKGFEIESYAPNPANHFDGIIPHQVQALWDFITLDAW